MAVWEINSRHLLLVSHPVYFVPWLSDNRWNEVRTIHHTISRVYCAVYLSFLLFSYTTVFCPSCLCFPILQLYCILCTSFTVYICSPIHTVFACPASQQAFLRSYLLYLSVIIPHFSFFVVHYLAAKPCVLHICRGFLYCTVPVLPAYDHQISLPPDCANSRFFLLSCLLFYYFWGLALLIFEFLLLVFRAIAQKTRRVPISGGKCTEAYSLPRPSDS